MRALVMSEMNATSVRKYLAVLRQVAGGTHRTVASFPFCSPSAKAFTGAESILLAFVVNTGTRKIAVKN